MSEESLSGSEATDNPPPKPRRQPPLRLLFAIPFGPRFDNRHGGRVVAQLVGRMTQRHEVGVVYLSAKGSPPIDPELAAQCAVVRRVELPERALMGVEWQHRFHVLSAPLFRRPSPVASVFSRQFARAVRGVALAWQPDIIQVEHDSLAYCAAALTDLGVPRVLVCHDPGLRASEDLARLIAGRQRLAHRIDAASWRSYWSRTFPNFDAVVAFTVEDADALRRFMAPPPPVVRIALGIDLPADALNHVASDPKSVLFVGGYSHPPNADAALRLLHSIAPAARRLVPGLQLLLVGDKPTEAMIRHAGPHDLITGTVPSVIPYVERASVVAIPIRAGGGMRVKLMEALGAGKAVVASPLAAAGLEVSDGQELILAETDQEFAEAIVALLADDGTRLRIAANARTWAVRNLAWDPRIIDYELLYRFLLARRSKQAATAPTGLRGRQRAAHAPPPVP